MRFSLHAALLSLALVGIPVQATDFGRSCAHLYVEGHNVFTLV